MDVCCQRWRDVCSQRHRSSHGYDCKPPSGQLGHVHGDSDSGGREPAKHDQQRGDDHSTDEWNLLSMLGDGGYHRAVDTRRPRAHTEFVDAAVAIGINGGSGLARC